MKSIDTYPIRVIIYLARLSGFLFSSYFLLMGMVIALGGPDGNAPLESRLIGIGFASYGLACVVMSLIKSEFLKKKQRVSILIYVVLSLPLLFLGYKEGRDITRLMSPFIAYVSCLAVFLLVKIGIKRLSVD